MQWLLSLLYTTFLFAATFVYGFLIICAGPLPYRYRFALARSWAQVQLGAVKLLCVLDKLGQARPAEVFDEGQRAGLEDLQGCAHEAALLADRAELNPHAGRQQRGSVPRLFPQHDVGAADQLPAAR